jgi:hypothetical protein
MSCSSYQVQGSGLGARGSGLGLKITPLERSDEEEDLHGEHREHEG